MEGSEETWTDTEYRVFVIHNVVGRGRGLNGESGIVRKG